MLRSVGLFLVARRYGDASYGVVLYGSAAERRCSVLQARSAQLRTTGNAAKAKAKVKATGHNIDLQHAHAHAYA